MLFLQSGPFFAKFIVCVAELPKPTAVFTFFSHCPNRTLVLRRLSHLTALFHEWSHRDKFVTDRKPATILFSKCLFRCNIAVPSKWAVNRSKSVQTEKNRGHCKSVNRQLVTYWRRPCVLILWKGMETICRPASLAIVKFPGSFIFIKKGTQFSQSNAFCDPLWAVWHNRLS